MSTRVLDSDAIQELLAAFPGRAGLLVKDLLTGTAFTHNADERFPVASVIKLPIMVELYRQVDAGRISLDQRLRLHDGICRFGTGRISTGSVEEFTILELCHLMIADSDDVATDLITEAIGLDQVNQTMADLGFRDTSVPMSMGRWHYTMAGMADVEINPENDAIVAQDIVAGRIDLEGLPFSASLDNNVSSARDMARMLEQIDAGELICAAASAAMLEMLHACEHRGMIPRDLDADIAIAHKIGQSTGIRADVGIVYLPKSDRLAASLRPVVIAVLTCAPEPGTARPGKDLIARIAKHVCSSGSG